jgi:hypothetical protein
MKNKFGFLPPPTRAVPLKSKTECFGEDDKYVDSDLTESYIKDYCQKLGEHYKPGSAGSFSEPYAEGKPEHFEMKMEWKSSAHLAANSVEDQCIDSMPKLIKDCDKGSRWKLGGAVIWGDETYVYYITPKHERPLPAPGKLPGKCDVWYKFLWDSFTVYGGGWAGNDHGQNKLLPNLRRCGALTKWKFEYLEEPFEDGMEWKATGRLPIGAQQWNCVRKAVVDSGGPSDVVCHGK